MTTDYRVRTQIRECLENNYFKNQNEPFAAHIAFQLAFCYQIGFGVKSDDNTCNMWLGKSTKQLDDLATEKAAVQPARWKMGGIPGYDGFVPVDLIHEYRTQGLRAVDQAREECERVIDDMAPVFGNLHFILLGLYTTLGRLLDEVGEFSKSKVMRMQIREKIEKTNGIDHPYYIHSIANVVRSHTMLGEWMEAQLLQEEVLKNFEGTHSWAVEPFKHNLASTYQNQGRWMEAEELKVQIMETRKRVLGQEHPDTLTSMGNLASTYQDQGRWKEAEELEVQVVETEKRVLGQEHPSTLISMGNLALTYQNQGRWKEAEELFVQVVETEKRVLGQEHPDTLTSMGNLTSTYQKQGRWKEAEELGVQVMETRKRVLGQKHPDTLASMAGLASTYRNQGWWKEAENLIVQATETRKRVLGQEHPDTLTSMANLASTYRGRRRWKEAEELEVQVAEIRDRVLGQKHPDTLSSMANLALTYRNQGQWNETEELGQKATEMGKRMLVQKLQDTLTRMASLAPTYSNQEAEELRVKVIKARMRVLVQEHPDTLASMAFLASTYNTQGQRVEAEDPEPGVKVIETRKGALDPEHPSALASMTDLASTWDLGQSEGGMRRLAGRATASSINMFSESEYNECSRDALQRNVHSNRRRLSCMKGCEALSRFGDSSPGPAPSGCPASPAELSVSQPDILEGANPEHLFINHVKIDSRNTNLTVLIGTRSFFSRAIRYAGPIIYPSLRILLESYICMCISGEWPEGVVGSLNPHLNQITAAGSSFFESGVPAEPEPSVNISECILYESGQKCGRDCRGQIQLDGRELN